MAKRIRQVWPTGNIAHMWAHQTQNSARNSQGNFSFRGPDLYSYSTVIARRYEWQGETVVLMLDRTWSNTTSGHQSEAHAAARHVKVFNVATLIPSNCAEYTLDMFGTDHTDNMRHFISKAEECAAKAAKARVYGPRYAETAARYLATAREYAALFGADRVQIPDLDIAALARDVLARQKAESADRKAARLERERQEKEYADALKLVSPRIIADWRATGSAGSRVDIAETGRYIYINLRQATDALDTGNLMRLDGSEVVTDLGARVDAQQVRFMVRVVLSAMDRQPATMLSGLIGRHIGPYAVSAVTCDEVRIGCHTFRRAEVQNIADILERANVQSASAEMTS